MPSAAPENRPSRVTLASVAALILGRSTRTVGFLPPRGTIPWSACGPLGGSTRRASPPRQAVSAGMPAREIPVQRHQNLFLGPARSNGPDCESQVEPLALVLLNTMANHNDKQTLFHLWSEASLRLCADGAANRLYDVLGEADRQQHVPDLIIGDLDSVRAEVAAYYEAQGAQVQRKPCQDHNDFEKCIMELQSRLGAVLGPAPAPAPGVTPGGGGAVGSSDAGEGQGRGPLPTIVALGAFGGRFDHEMAAISVLHRYTPGLRGGGGRLILMGGGNLAFLLEPGREHVIVPDPRFEGPTCGLLPIGGPCRSVTTRGLRWDLDGGELGFGALVSSSNEVAAPEVRVTTDAPLVWTVELNTEAWVAALMAANGRGGHGGGGEA